MSGKITKTMSEVKRISWEEIKLIWETQLWPNKTGGVKPYNKWTWRYPSRYFGFEYNMEVSPVFFGIYEEDILVSVNSCYMSNDWRDSVYFRSRGLWTSPEYRKQGYASSILLETIKYAKENSGTWIWSVPRNSALVAYENVGFKQWSAWMGELEYGPNCIATKYL